MEQDDDLKITVRITEADLDDLGRLIPSRFMNVSDAVRAAIRLLVQTHKGGVA